MVEEGTPRPILSGMAILDVRSRPWGGIGVWGADLDASRGAITFWARDVVDLNAIEAA